MTPTELALACADAMSRCLDSVQLVLPRRCGGGRRMVVFKKPRIYGEVACENANGHTVVWVSAVEVLAMLVASGAVKVELEPKP